MKTNVSGGRWHLIVDVLIALTIILSAVFFKDFRSDQLPHNSTVLLVPQNDPSFEMADDEFPNFALPAVTFEKSIREKVPSDFTLGPFQPLIPPISAYTIPVVSKSIEAGTGERITTNKHSVIQIPASAFVDASGKRITGKVDVSYREFHDRWDIFMSGIPMHYDSADSDLLESAGMIEINASQNGNELFPDPVNKINVMLASANPNDGFNVYYYDKIQNKWIYQSKDFKITEAVDRLYKTKDKQPQDAQIPPQQIKPPRTDFSFMTNKYSTFIYCKSNMSPRRKYFFSHKKRPDHFEFTVSPRKNSPPEDKLLKKQYWTYKGNDAAEVYDILFSDNGRLPRNLMNVTNFQIQKSDSTYTLSFTKNSVLWTLSIEPFYEREKFLASFDTAFSKYRTAFETRIINERNNYAFFLSDSAAMASSLERGAITSNEGRILRIFTINNFGIWNCDKPYKLDLPKTVNAKFKDENGRMLLISNGYLVIAKVNTVVAVNDMKKFKYNTSGKMVFWAVLNGNRIAVVYPEEFAKHNIENSENVFITKVFEDMSAAKTEIQRILKIKERTNV